MKKARLCFTTVVILAVTLSSLESCTTSRSFVRRNLDYCVAQAGKTVAIDASYDSLPRNVLKGQSTWNYGNYKGWTSGFWPGILWYVYDYTKDTSWKTKADGSSRALTKLAYSKAGDHDLGFQMYCSFGNGLRLTGNEAYKKILLATADTLATLFDPRVGTILSWPHNVKRMGGHNTIVDNMINLELLFWAAKNGGSHRLYDIAVQHANTTMRNHFRPDYSAYHVVIYDTLTGKAIKKHTHQGYADGSMWARGQSWAIYGYTMSYRETKDTAYRSMAQHTADIFLQRLPADKIPYWDFDAPGPDQPRDASAAAVTASALLELSTLVEDAAKAKHYRKEAEALLKALSTAAYQSRNTSPAFLQHSTGHKPGGSEIDASIIYADYYYIEALLRLKRLQEGKAI